MIVWLASYPRSGNTFFRMLLWYQYGIKTYSVYDDPLFDEIGASDTVGHELLPAPLEELADREEIYVVKTHDLPQDNHPAIYIVRDGRDALVSHARYINSFDQSEKPRGILRKYHARISFRRTLQQLILADEPYGGWSRNVLQWTHQREAGFTFVVRYEDLVEDPDLWMKKTFDSLHWNVCPEGTGELPDFEELHDRWPQFFRKGKIGSWQDEMPEQLHELFWQHHGEVMQAHDYSFGRIDAMINRV